MKLLIDARPMADPRSGGVKRVAEGLTDEIIRQNTDHEITLFTTGAKEKTLSIPPNTRHVHAKKPNKYLSASMLLGRGLESFLPGDFGHIFFPNLGFTGRLRTPYSLLVHDLSFLIEPSWFSPRARAWHKAIRPIRMIREASTVFAVSEKTKSDLARLTGRTENVHVIPLAPSAPSSSQLQATGQKPHASQRYFFAFGSNDRRKNLSCTVEAMKALKEDARYNDVKLFVTGTEDWGLPWVKPLGRPTDTEIAEYIRNATALLYPSWYEGYGLPIHESLNYGTPVIAAATGAIPEKAPRDVMLIQPEKPHLWRTALESVLVAEGRAQPSDSTSSWTTAASMILHELEGDNG